MLAYVPLHRVLTPGSGIAEKYIILWRNESVPLQNMMDQESVTAINRALFHQQAPAHIRIINARRNTKGVVRVITHQNATVEMALQHCGIIITAARTVDKTVVDVEENESWESLKMHTVPLVRYIGKGIQGRQMMQEEFEAEKEGITIPTEVWWLANCHTIREQRQNGEIAVTSVVFVVKGSNAAEKSVRKRHQGGGSVVPSRNVHECGP